MRTGRTEMGMGWHGVLRPSSSHFALHTCFVQPHTDRAHSPWPCALTLTVRTHPDRAHSHLDACLIASCAHILRTPQQGHALWIIAADVAREGATRKASKERQCNALSAPVKKQRTAEHGDGTGRGC